MLTVYMYMKLAIHRNILKLLNFRVVPFFKSQLQNLMIRMWFGLV